MWLKKWGAPDKILSDQGRQYISSKFRDLTIRCKIKHMNSSPHNPTGNSISERINQTIGDVLRLYKGRTLKELKDAIYTRINYTVNRTIGKSPFEVTKKTDIFGIGNVNWTADWEDIKKRIKEKSAKETLKRNKKRKYFKYEKGGLVYKKNNSQDKVDDRWKGPFEIVEVNGNVLQIMENGKITKQNIKNLRPAEKGGGCRTTRL